jgi:hypothetical protein
MKTAIVSFSPNPLSGCARAFGSKTRQSRRGSQDGTAVIVVLVFLSLLLIYITANLRTLYSLGRELKLIDQKQTRRLESSSRTNTFLTATNFKAALNLSPLQIQAQNPTPGNQ